VLGSASTEPIAVRNMANKFEHAICVDDVVVAVVVDDDDVVVVVVAAALSKAPVAAVPVFLYFLLHLPLTLLL